MKFKSILYFLPRPYQAYRQFLWKIYQWRHPEEPWIVPEAVPVCEKILNNKMLALEWGSGRSTLWYAKRVEKLISIEHNLIWYDLVKEKLANSKIDNVEYIFAQEHSAGSDGVSEYVAAANKYEDETVDFIVVDGALRQDTLKMALRKIKQGGYILLDNSGWMPLEKWGVPRSWPIIHRSNNVISETTIWQKV